MGLWKSLLVALGLAKKKVRVEAGAGTRSPRPRRRRPSSAILRPRREKGTSAFLCLAVASIEYILESLASDGD